MKTLIISDLHLGRFINLKKLDFLHSLFSSYDQIILNGDFWCYYNFDFKNFLDSEWNKLFPVLKQKETIYIHGNHDREKWCLEGANVFSNIQSQGYKLEIEGQKYFIEHGDLPLDRLCFNSELIVKASRLINPWGAFLSKSLNTNLDSIVFSRKLLYFLNTRLKRYALENFSNYYYISGHTHYAEVDRKSQYINTGKVGEKIAEFLEISGKNFQLNSCIM